MSHVPHEPDPAAAPLPMETMPEDVRDRLQSADPPLLLDCRTPAEREVACIEPSLHVPMQEIEQHLETLTRDPDRAVVVYCHHGVRSLRVARALRGVGLHRTQSMIGGIERWSVTIDPAVPRY
ncbi:MAG: rhodanese-like domain-containing protein [Planctomycetota bacterium]|jgi:rhodanese-related sulfurtransferase